MSKYGAKYGRWAEFAAAEPAAAAPSYKASMSLGPLNKAADSPTLASAALYGDDVLRHSRDMFSRGTLTYTSTNLPTDTAVAIYGAKKADSGDEVTYGLDTAPYGGVAFYCELDDENTGKTIYRGVFYPKCKAVPSGDEFNSIGDSLVFTTDAINFTVFLRNVGGWKLTEDFDTEAEAIEWVDTKLPKTVAGG